MSLCSLVDGAKPPKQPFENSNYSSLVTEMEPHFVLEQESMTHGEKIDKTKSDKKIDAKMAESHIYMVKQKLAKNGVMDRQNFWKWKRALALKSLGIPHAIEGTHGNLITDPGNINDEYRNEFRHTG